MNADMLDSPGTRIGNEILDFVPASANIRPLRDVIVIEPLPIDHGTSLTLVYRGKPVRGKVLAVGPGVYPRRYDGPKGRRTKSWVAKCFRPCDLKVGDIVDIGGLELDGYLHPTVRWGDKEVVLCREEDVAVVIENDWSKGCPKCGCLEQLTDVAGTCRRCGNQENPFGLAGASGAGHASTPAT